MIRRVLDAFLGRASTLDPPLAPYLRPVARPRQPPAVAERPAPPAPSPPPAPLDEAPPPRLAALLASRSALRQAILMQEVLGPPKGLRPARRRAAADE
jgi:hypothetical protein